MFDIGAGQGEDTGYYLGLGCQVVAVDADDRKLERITRKFDRQHASGQLVVVQGAVSDQEGARLTFHLSRDPQWSSLLPEIASRSGMYARSIEVSAVSLTHLMSVHGVPHYCKIDIEGYDLIALQSLSRGGERPVYISAESECLSDLEDSGGEADPLATLNALGELGYTRFKLVDQRTLTVLSPGERFYGTANATRSGLDEKTLSRLRRLRVQARERRRFPPGATGPFGTRLAGEWLGHELAAQTLLRHRREYFAGRHATPIGFWCDWHATGPSDDRSAGGESAAER